MNEPEIKGFRSANFSNYF